MTDEKTTAVTGDSGGDSDEGSDGELFDLDAEVPLNCGIAYFNEAVARLDDGSQAKTTIEAAIANANTVLENEFGGEE